MGGIAILFIVTGLVLGLGVYVNTSIEDQFYQNVDNYSSLIANNTTAGISALAQWLPIIAVVLASGVVIGTLVLAFSTRGDY